MYNVDSIYNTYKNWICKYNNIIQPTSEGPFWTQVDFTLRVFPFGLICLPIT